MEDDDIRAALARGNDEVAFKLLRDRHGRAVLDRCVRVFRDRTLAEDALQEAFILVLRKRGKLSSVASLRGWLIRVATRHALNVLRKQARRDKIDEEHPDVEPEVAVTTDQSPWSHADRATLDACLATLEPSTGAALLMWIEDGLPWDEISDVLDIPVDRIRMRVQRGALKQLRSCLESKGVKL